MKTPADLEAIYKSGMAISHTAALQAVYDAGALDGVADTRAQADLTTTPQQKQTQWNDRGSFIPFAPSNPVEPSTTPDPLAAVRNKLKSSSRP